MYHIKATLLHWRERETTTWESKKNNTIVSLSEYITKIKFVWHALIREKIREECRSTLKASKIGLPKDISIIDRVRWGTNRTNETSSNTMKLNYCLCNDLMRRLMIIIMKRIKIRGDWSRLEVVIEQIGDAFISAK